MFDLTGRTALVTGASGGIGRAIAQALSEAGAKVALSGTRENVLEEVAGTLKGESAIVPCNLSDAESVDGLVGRAEEAIGPLDILVANAGITRDKLLMQMKDEDWNDVLSVNLGSYFRLTKSCVRGMMKRRHGRIIGITSIVGVTGNPGQANYCASKAGMIGFTKSLAQEVASRGITANTIAPGFIESPMTEVLPEKQKDALLGQIPAGRLGQGADIAAAAIYLASDQAAYVTGQTIHVNGGMAMI
ncbi:MULTISPECIES: 3-oxoacyl-[acyl-carrier-protein] reductase [unclassified Hyphomonas]|jgi:3-oxoacyl-[acyl-carrier protein] reductase|uniref:3-oxoacyl-[acyl-carrier protein] reductase n=3 Tax=root TaxID=1 RepID=A0A160U046_9ZZZZ|nr:MULTISPECIES: 3-oxoacyl-[acyl-carrier-protein] reductase [unclassified Hyphomonas]MAN92223.1 3-oxoacyl-[acyl-carrier-protein] reductase [Hyphomonadaceae bacterium]MAA81228.1 3-oxoacyl-[acyl-carrier-protein] reductase [Hyphomonas sp.]MAL47860.1 3-oxoacyl-[acyl-carrier-protein] reductase [Hyphomonas sp.]MBG66686.1 3-oxoacyl-[acyl-carrier-protein] reductase [Hyphomonas sp.]QSR22580.1 3-oxoacyl-[acyl-carrier-protein] reductase [Hyphomonas sp. KY3]|tara:strand:+ start:973 stop:1710 length:738 start_codon:yes stop_codon:yes gene_type:complete